MCDVKDPAIKLFGKTISLPESQMLVDSGEKSDLQCQIPAESEDQDVQGETAKLTNEDSPEEALCDADKSSALLDGKEENCEAPTTHVGKTTLDPKLERDQVKTESIDQEKVLKKPDKILPCPRCNSMDTKFCYYNNYNVNQPRHFCKNCQRYWTAGGTMRNVPIGAGRRKNKHMATQYRHIVMSSDGQTSQINGPDSVNFQALPCGGSSTHSRPLNGNGTVLKFGSDVPLCESMASVLTIGDQKKQVEMDVVVSGKNGEEPSSCRPSAMTFQENELPQSVAQMEEGCVPGFFNETTPTYALQCYPSPWFYPGWNGSAAIASGPCSSELVYVSDNGNHKQTMVASPAFCAPTAPFPFVPASYWGCIPGWAPRTCNVPWVGSNGSISSSSSTSNSGCSSNGSPTLGKHSRDVNMQGDDKARKFLWVPKTQRIDDPDEAAKSSIWATLGIKPDQKEPITKGGIFKPFHSKTQGNDHASDATHVLHANPAALSRSQTFQENM